MGIDECTSCTDGNNTLRCMRPGLCHATRVTPLPLHPLDARGRVQVAGERAADDRHIESCGVCLTHAHTNTYACIYVHTHIDMQRCTCACRTHNRTDDSGRRWTATDGDVMQLYTQKHALVLRSSRSSSSRGQICRTGQSGCTSRHSDSDPRFWHSAAPSGHSGSKAPVVGRYRHVHTN